MPENHSIIAFDFGERRIGCAHGNAMIQIAHPLETITGKSNQEKFQKIQKIIQTWQPEKLVVGLPFQSDGKPSEITPLVRKFAHRLHRTFQLPIYLVDERYSSAMAEELLKEAHVFGRKQKPVLDQVAAMAILDSYFSGNFCETISE